MELGLSSLVHEKWSIHFDVLAKKLDIIPIWVSPPRLSLMFWSKKVFKEIGNTSSFYYVVVFSFQQTSYMVVSHFLVLLNLTLGLLESISLVWVILCTTKTNVNFETGTLAKKPRKNIKNNAKNEKCVYWNDGFFFRVNFEHVLKMAVKTKFLFKKQLENEKVMILE